MKRYYDTFVEFAIDTESQVYELLFTTDWKFNDMLDFMCDNFEIDRDSIVEVRHTFVKHYKLSKDD